ncbi:MAG: NADH-quinone oxidoreductase subunit H [Hydrogenobacter thermophilus]|nr:MAG: NADH-quinone oxidoreductase subunit H [Hydrogenobacter thermophilus]
MNLAFGILQGLMVLILAPFFAGFVHRLKQRARGQKGVSPFQYYRNLYKLLKKETVLSKDATLVSYLAPFMYLLPHILLSFMMPFFYGKPLLAPTNPILITYLMALAVFFLTLYALDQASSFGGLGSSREWFLSSLSEPAFLLLLFSVCLYSKEWDLSIAFLKLGQEVQSLILGYTQHFSVSIPFLLIISLFVLMLAENARIPFDNPETHLELTMIHEANILEASGRHLLLFEYASHLRLTVFLSLISILIFPYIAQEPFYFLLAFALYFLKMLLLGSVLAFVESINAKMRLFRLPNILSVAFVLSLLTLILSMGV